MGYMHGTITDKDGKKTEVGYGVPDTCHEPDCTEAIDRGMAYLCGSVHGGDEHSCGGYFCSSHLYGSPEGHIGDRCLRCRDRGATDDCPARDGEEVAR